MSTKSLHPFLPPDIILNIVDCLIPAEDIPPIALPPWHLTTLTLLSLTRTSRLLYAASSPILYTYCAYIDSPQRLQGLLGSLSDFKLRLSRPPPGPVLHMAFTRHITSLYLSIFPGKILDGSSPLWEQIAGLLIILAPNLRRLVIDVALRGYLINTNHLPVSMEERLWFTFTQLTSLEFFCSTRDNMGFICTQEGRSIEEPGVWTFWPKLRTLALFNIKLFRGLFWERIVGLRQLETLVLTRSRGAHFVDIKRELMSRFKDKERRLSVVLVNVDEDHDIPIGREGWKEDDNVTVREVSVPVSYYWDEGHLHLCEEWVKRRMLQGEARDCWT